MRTAPAEITDEGVVEVVRHGWGVDIAEAEHVPWGFGAWHWAGRDKQGERRWFITADRLESPTRLQELERAYATAEVVSETLPALAPIARPGGEICWKYAGFAVSVTPWVEATRSEHGESGAEETSATVEFLASLHSLEVPSMTREWSPTYPSHATLDDLRQLLESDWAVGPFGEQARQLLASCADRIDAWRTRYAHCAQVALERRSDWVLTHGEPGSRNQLETLDGQRLWVDWESALVAPRERDLTNVAAANLPWQQGYPHSFDPVCLELFDLAWRLDEIGQYAARFFAPHGNSEDDCIAWGGLQHELTRVDRY